jgi:anti-anti-sigma factor
MIYSFVIGSMLLSRLAVDNTLRLETALSVASDERARAEAEQVRAEQQARELEQRAHEQARLLELISVLETPTIHIADGVLLVPVVGALDSRRAQVLTTRLLREVSEQRMQRVILDIGGVTAVDTQVAQVLLQTANALRMLGCRVAITGITATVAMTLTQLGVAMNEVVTARSPQDVLAASSMHSGPTSPFQPA